VTRRSFLASAGTAAAAFTIVPRHVLGGPGTTAPSDRLNIAGIGVGGQGHGDIKTVADGNNIVALCDVDWSRAAGTFKEFPKAKQYRDFRRMFDEMDKDIDAVVVATPDHTHAVAAMAAIQRGKHLYCEKPLAHSFHEVRELTKAAAAQKKIVTQLGNQGHSFTSCRLFVEWIRDGAIGKVKEVHCGCPWANSGADKLSAVRAEKPPVPKDLDWDLWLGPVQTALPYHTAYVPQRWRGWVPFGSGTLGDWLCHIVDPVYWALELDAPTSIVAEVKDWDRSSQADVYPLGDHVTFEFAARGERGPVSVHWYSGTFPRPLPGDLEPSRKPPGIGGHVIGEKGTITYGSHGATGCRLVPETKMREYTQPAPSLPRVAGHHRDWLEAIGKGTKAGSDFAYGGPLTEVAMLGVIAVRLAGTKLLWDAKEARFTNSDEANAMLKTPYRQGWTL
jgi:predicted dehydrogenase